MTIDESNGLSGTRYYSQDQQDSVPNSHFIGMSGQNEYTMAQPILRFDQNITNGYGMQNIQPSTSLANGQYRQNQSINTNNRTYNVRPQPIQLCSSDRFGPVTTEVSKSLNDGIQKNPSVKSKDVPQDAPKSILRSVTPRRMIINVQHPASSRSVTPRRMDTTAPDLTPVRYSSPRNNRSRLRTRRDDSTRSMASTTSIAFDKIFTEFAEDGVSSYKNKNANSGASFLSLMSLSVGEAILSDDEKGTNNQISLITSSENKQSIEATTVTSASVRRVPPKRNGSSEIMNLERGVYDMSVNTISIDDISDAASSQDDMSYFNIFED